MQVVDGNVIDKVAFFVTLFVTIEIIMLILLQESDRFDVRSIIWPHSGCKAPGEFKRGYSGAKCVSGQLRCMHVCMYD